MKKQSKLKKTGKINSVKAWGILNQNGDFWTPITFLNKEMALNHAIEFFKSIKRPNYIKCIKIIPVLITPLKK